MFYPDGQFKFAFGTKGSLDGELDLPAGVTTDRQNRIIVADKDNHRIQVFSSTGRFILKFGGYGRDLGVSIGFFVMFATGSQFPS